jgi:hypothetical protein
LGGRPNRVRTNGESTICIRRNLSVRALRDTQGGQDPPIHQRCISFAARKRGARRQDRSDECFGKQAACCPGPSSRGVAVPVVVAALWSAVRGGANCEDIIWHAVHRVCLAGQKGRTLCASAMPGTATEYSRKKEFLPWDVMVHSLLTTGVGCVAWSSGGRG